MWINRVIYNHMSLHFQLKLNIIEENQSCLMYTTTKKFITTNEMTMNLRLKI